MYIMEQQKIESLEKLNRFAKNVLLQMKKKKMATVVGLSGELGSGKTALTKEFAKSLGIKKEITSPTFVVMKSYVIPQHDFLETLVHIDAYRIESDDEMEVLKFSELLEDPTKLIIIEWPEHIKKLLPKETIFIKLTIKDGETREITYDG